MSTELAKTGLLSSNDLPEAWRPWYVIKRINGSDIKITRDMRDKILEAMTQGARFVQIREITLMVNSLQAIEPFWGEPNIPPRPQERWITHTINEMIESRNTVKQLEKKELVNKEEVDLWDKHFANKLVKKSI